MTFPCVEDAEAYLFRVGFERKGRRLYVRRSMRRKQVAVIERGPLSAIVLFF